MPATDKFAYNLKKLHVVFALACFGIFVATFWMMASDHRDEWRQYQKIGFQIEAAKAEIAKLGVETGDFTQKLEELAAARQEAEEAYAAGEEGRAELKAERAKLAQEVDILTRRIKVERAFRDVARADYDLGISQGVVDSQLDDLKSVFDDKQKVVENTQVEFETADTAFRNVDTEFKSARTALDEIVAAEKKETADRDRIAGVLEKIAPSGGLAALKRPFMEWPIIDGFNSHLRITQDWMPGLSQTLGMTEIARFDRCRTCHMMIDRTEAGGVPAFPAGHPETDDVKDWVAKNEYPQPYSTHPNHDLYTTATSPHPVAKFGCTICHDGQGSGTSFGNAEHTPNDPHQGEDWHHDFGHHPNHFWEYPMHPKRFIESGCIKCHHSVTELGVNAKWGASAPKVYEGYSLIEQYGCFGCHEIHGYDGGQSIGPDLRLEPQTPEEAKKVAEDPGQIAGKMRKVGPSLRHVADKTTKDFLSYWTKEPKRFRETTRMPQFFGLTNQMDPHAIDFEPAELEGIALYLMAKSEANELLKPVDGYQPDVKRGRLAFAERGCLACHTHNDFAKEAKRNAELIAGWETASHGPDLSRIHEKVNRNADGKFSDWLYTWVRNPELHHPRTRMPNVYLDAENGIDPAADITAYLLSKGEPGTFTTVPVPAEDDHLIELVRTYLSKALSGEAVTQTIGKKVNGEWKVKPSKVYGGPDSGITSDQIKSDEIELFTADGSVPDNETWQQMQLKYVGRRTISRYGCYGCHEIPGFEKARPIGAALQDWGRKDTSKLAFEHIHEWLHHHGEPGGASTYDRVESAVEAAAAGGIGEGYFGGDKSIEEKEMSAAFFYKSATSHGRPGFIWQKLRQPRSYDYEKVETKGYDERLRMPKFPFNEQQIEAIATFVLGLVAEPPSEDYQYRPAGAAKDIIEGEKLIKKYNCTGCHILDLPKIRYGVDLAEIKSDKLIRGEAPAEHKAALDLLNKLKPARQGLTGERRTFSIDGEDTELDILAAHGLRVAQPDTDEDLVDQLHSFQLWENLKVGDKQLLPPYQLNVPVEALVDITPARGGRFAESLVEHLKKTKTSQGPEGVSEAWNMAPPPLYKEGIKVQNQWLYQFLLEPGKIRPMTVLRMPRFNMSPEEAQTLANYFAAVDGAEYPYQENTTGDPDYIAARTEQLAEKLDGHDYQEDAWKALNGPLCISCHNVGRREAIVDPKKPIRGPNLPNVAKRLRPDWVQMWISKPSYVTPYTKMPANFPANQKQYPDVFKGDAGDQVIGIRDALMNYDQLMERYGPVVYDPKKNAPADAAAKANEGQ